MFAFLNNGNLNDALVMGAFFNLGGLTKKKIRLLQTWNGLLLLCLATSEQKEETPEIY